MADEYILQGNSRWYYCPAIVDENAPTVAEIVTDGTELTEATRAVNGWSFKTNRAEVPNGRSAFIGTIAGTQKAEDSSLVIYMNLVSNPLRTLLTRGTQGYIVFVDYCPTGDPTAGLTCDVFPIEVSGRPKRRAFGDDAVDWMLECSITTEPFEDVAIAA